MWQFTRDEVSTDNADLTVDNSVSFKRKSALVGKTTGAVDNTDSSLKTTQKNSCSNKVSKQFLEITRNVSNQLPNSS